MTEAPPLLATGALLLLAPVLFAAFVLLVALALAFEAEVDAADALLALVDVVDPDALELPVLAAVELAAEGVPDGELTDATVLSEFTTKYAL